MFKDEAVRGGMIPSRLWIGALLVVAGLCFGGCERQLAPDFAASVTQGTPGLEVTFTNMSQTRGGAKVGSESSLGANDNEKRGGSGPSEPKAPDRTQFPRGTERPIETPSSQALAAFVLNARGTVAVGTAISATNTSQNVNTSEWEVSRISGASREVIATQTSTHLGGVMLDEAGQYEIQLLVRDISGNSDMARDLIRAENRTASQEVAVYTWDFGDGSDPMTLSSPDNVTHTYAEAGRYTVSLTMEQGGSRMTTTKRDYIQVYHVPEARFTTSATEAIAPQPVTFMDMSTVAPPDRIVEWEWDFGDGTPPVITMTPTVEHMYMNPGVYDLTLRVRTEFGGESVATRSSALTVFEATSPSRDITGNEAFSLSNFLPLAPGNRWIYRSTGSVSFLPFHFSLGVQSIETRTNSRGDSIDVYTMEIHDVLDRSTTFLWAVVDNVLYTFLDDIALENYLVEGFLESFYTYPVVGGNLAPGPSELLNPGLGPLPVEYEAGSLFSFLPRVWNEDEYLAVLFGGKSASKAVTPARSRLAAGGKSSEKSSSTAGTFVRPKRFPFALGGEASKADAKQGGAGVPMRLVGVADQSNSIAMALRDEAPLGNPILYILSEGLGITYLTGSAVVGQFPVSTIGPGTDFFAFNSTFVLTGAVIDGEYIGSDDHLNLITLDGLYDSSSEADIPTLLLPSFGPVPAFLTPGDRDVFVLDASFSGGGEYQLEITPPEAPVMLTLIESDLQLEVQAPRTFGQDLTFTQNQPFSIFFLTAEAQTPGATVDFSVALTLQDDHGDELASATAIQPNGMAVSGNLQSFGDIDVFRFEALSGTTYTIETFGNGLSETDTTLTLVDANGQELAFDDDGGSNLFSRIIYTADDDGPLFAFVRGFADIVTGSYMIRVSIGAGTGGSVDPMAIPVDSGPIPGAIESGGSFDLFYFEATAGTTYVIRTLAASFPPLDTVIFLLDSTGELLQFDDDSGGDLLSRIVYTAPMDETLFVEVQGFSSFDVGPYFIEVLTGTGQAGEVVFLEVDGPPVMGGINFGGDIDMYSFEAQTGVTYQIETSPATGGFVDTVLLLVDTMGQVLAVDDDGGQGLYSLLQFTAATDGTLFVRVRGFSSFDVGPYLIEVRTGSGTVDPPVVTPVTVNGGPVAGVIEVPGDLAIFSFEAEAGVAYVVETHNAGPNTIDTVIYVLEGFDSLGAPIIIGADDDGGEGLLSRFEFVAGVTGTHYVLVDSFDGSETGPFQLSISTVSP